MSTPPELEVHIAARRRALGLSQGELAEQIGVSRQALSAIEGGRSVPATSTALRIAQALGCPVESLFSLVDLGPAGLHLPALSGARLALGRVGQRWVAHPLDPRGAEPADGLVGPDGRVALMEAPAILEGAALVAGCAPVLGVLSGLTGREGSRWLQSPSGAALRALAEGRVHVAGLHLAAHDAPQEHDRLVRAALPGEALEIVRLVVWREGLAFAPGSPLGAAGLEGLARPGVRVGRRPEGSGAAQVLNQALAQLGGPPVEGPELPTHLDAAWAVRHGVADVAVLVEPVAAAFGLDFLPLREERFELVLRASDRAHPGVNRLLEALNGARFSREVRGMGAYDVRRMGASRRVEAA